MKEQLIRFEGENADIAKLVTKLVGILGKCKAVKKSGHNKAQKYQYATEADILEVVRDQLITNKIFVFSGSNTNEIKGLDKYDYKTGEKNGETILAVVNGEHAFVDGETGARVIVSSTGTGWDMTDKGVFKAITGLNKYMFSKNFLIESEDDPERDDANPGYVRNSGSSGGSKSSGQPKAKTTAVKQTFIKNTAAKAVQKVASSKEPTEKKSFGDTATQTTNSEPEF